MAVWLGTLQLILDKGQESDWFAADWIRWTAVLSAVALLCFVVRELRTQAPIVHLRILADRNFSVGTAITTIYGFVLYGVTAMLPLFLQTLLGYSALRSGLAVSPRGIGSMSSMLLAGVLVNYVDNRLLIAIGFSILGSSTFMLSHLNLGIAMSSVVLPNIINGFATGFIFVPLTTMTMGQLPQKEIGNAAGIYNLMRNIGGSIGIASISTLLSRGAQVHQAYLVQNISPYNPQLEPRLRELASQIVTNGAQPAMAHQLAMGLIYKSLQKQASLLAYADSFRLLGYLALVCMLLALRFHRVRKTHSASPMSE
jgi:DHA2 family multidrug resistance protein